MDYRSRIGFYALQDEVSALSIDSIEQEVPSIRQVRMANSFHQPVAVVNYQAKAALNVIIEEPTRLEPTRLSWLGELYNRPMNRREFITTTAGIGVMALGVRAMLENKLAPRAPTVSAPTPRGFGNGPYGA